MPAVFSKPILVKEKNAAEIFAPLHDSFLGKLCDIHQRSTSQAITPEDLEMTNVSLSAISEAEIGDFIHFFDLASKADIDVFNMMPSGAITAVSLLALQKDIIEIISPILKSKTGSDLALARKYLDYSLGGILKIAAQNCGSEMINFLIDSGVDPNGEPGLISALYLAVKSGNIAATKALIERGSDPNASFDSLNFTPAYVATLNCQQEILRAISSHKDFDPNITSGQNKSTPLFCAALYGYKNIVEILLQGNGVEIDVNMTNEDGNSALHAALLSGNVDIIALLLNKGADKDLQNNKGLSPMDFAKEAGCQEIIDLLNRGPKNKAKRYAYNLKSKRAKRDFRVSGVEESSKELALKISEASERLDIISARVNELLRQQQDRHVEFDDFRQATEMRVAKELDAQAQEVADKMSAESASDKIIMQDELMAADDEKKHLRDLLVNAQAKFQVKLIANAANFLQSRYDKMVFFDKVTNLVNKACEYYSWLQNFKKFQSQTVNLAKDDQDLQVVLNDNDTFKVSNPVFGVVERNFDSLVSEVKNLVLSSWNSSDNGLDSQLLKSAIDEDDPIKLQVLQEMGFDLGCKIVINDSVSLDPINYSSQIGADHCKETLQEFKGRAESDYRPQPKNTFELSNVDNFTGRSTRCL